MLAAAEQGLGRAEVAAISRGAGRHAPATRRRHADVVGLAGQRLGAEDRAGLQVVGEQAEDAAAAVLDHEAPVATVGRGAALAGRPGEGGSAPRKARGEVRDHRAGVAVDVQLADGHAALVGQEIQRLRIGRVPLRLVDAGEAQLLDVSERGRVVQVPTATARVDDEQRVVGIEGLATRVVVSGVAGRRLDRMVGGAHHAGAEVRVALQHAFERTHEVRRRGGDLAGGQRARGSVHGRAILVDVDRGHRARGEQGGGYGEGGEDGKETQGRTTRKTVHWGDGSCSQKGGLA